MTDVSIQISGMHCQSCVQQVRDAVKQVPGVLSCNAEVGSSQVQFDESECSVRDVVEAIRSAGDFDTTAFHTTPAE